MAELLTDYKSNMKNTMPLILLIFIAGFGLFFIQSQKALRLPQNTISALLEKQQALILNPWKLNFYSCGKSEFSANNCKIIFQPPESLALPDPRLTEKLIHNMAATNNKADYVSLTYNLLPSDRVWIKSNPIIDLIIPLAVHNATTLFIEDKKIIKSLFNENNSYRIRSAPFEKNREINMLMDIRDLSWFGPNSAPIAMVNPAFSNKYNAIPNNILTLSNIRRAFDISLLLSVVMLSLLLGHKSVFFALSLYLGFRALRMAFYYANEINLYAGNDIFWNSGLLIISIGICITLMNFLFSLLKIKVASIKKTIVISVAILIHLCIGAFLSPHWIYFQLDTYIEIGLSSCAILLSIAAIIQTSHNDMADHNTYQNNKGVLLARAGTLIAVFAIHAIMRGFEIYDIEQYNMKDPIPWFSMFLPASLLSICILDVAYASKVMDQNAYAFSNNHKIADDIQSIRKHHQNRIKSATSSSRLVKSRCFYYPSISLSGDWVSIADLKIGSREFVAAMLIDVVGHGSQAALLSSHLSLKWEKWKQIVTNGSYFQSNLAVDMLFHCLFDELTEDLRFLQGRPDFSAATVIIDFSEQSIFYVTAGHPPIMYKTPNGTKFLSSGSAGRLSEFYSINIECVPLIKDTQLILYSDGIVHPDQNVSKLQTKLEQDPQNIAMNLLKIIRENKRFYRKNRHIEDDMTALIIDYREKLGAKSEIA